MKKLNLLVCTSEYYPYGSGIANVAYNIVERLKKMGIDCTVCSPTGPGIELRSLKGYGLLGLIPYWHKVNKYFKKRADDYDVAWIHNPLFLKDNPFPRSLVTIHSTYYGKMVQRVDPKSYNKIASQIERYCLNKIDKRARFTGVGINVCKELEEIGVDRQKITYIPNGVNTEQFKPSDNKKRLRKKFGIPEDDLILLSLGRLTEAKQPLKLIEVFSVIEKKMNDITLVIGGMGELLNKTKEFVRQKKLKNVKFLGYVDREKDAPDLYACSDLFIIPSKYEGAGPTLTLAEAMASGLPCIVSDIPNFRFIDGDKSGIVVDFNDIGKAAKRIIEYVRRDNSEHAKNAREYAIKNLDWKIIARRYLGEFEKI